jgi:lipopolysaccharide/colanic/teichoic acid biosynthesis glycosyltransferase
MREGEEIEIVFTGLRPGEKLYEELHSDAERTRMTRHERILTWELDARVESELLAEVDELEQLARASDPAAIKRMLHRIVPEYVEPQHAPYEAVPAAPLVELPAAATPAPRPTSGRQWRETARTGVESAVAALLLAASAPLWLLLAIEGRLRGAGEILYRERRVGRTRRSGPRRSVRVPALIDRRVAERRTQDRMGQPFECLRFRTDLGPVSRWTGRHRLDKIPFLLNVMRREMTLVGPHPEKEELVLRWQGLVPDYARRFSVQPGVTGLAQIADCGDEGGAEGVIRRVHYDLYYIDHRSLLLDLRALWRTIAVVARRPRSRPSVPAAPASPVDGAVLLGPTAATREGAVVKGVTQ